ncbi:MAG TPA: hypothetical protein VLT62_28845 [Candidatus Methylomirabilis sp.]|nr:hypothetical protein [Candidatus Methylomirabilis sp.]
MGRRQCGGPDTRRAATRPRKAGMPKTRRTWAIRPATRPHSSPKGKKGYDRGRDKAVRDKPDDV